MAAMIFFADRKKFIRAVADYKNFFALMILFFAWIIISMLIGGNIISSESSPTYWIFFSYNMFLFLPTVLLTDKSLTEKILIAIAISLLVDDIFVAWQYFNDVNRPITFLKGSFMQGTMIYVILLPALLILALRKNIFYAVIFLLSLISFVLLNTRGAWIDLAIVLPAILIYHIRDWKKLSAIAGIGIILTGLFLIASPSTFDRVKTIGKASSEQSVTERFLMWQSALNMIKDNPLLGVGFGNYAEQYQNKYILPEAKEREQKHSHNVYLQFQAETGLPGLLLLCALFGYILLWSWQRRENIFARIIFFSTIALMLYGMTDYTISGYRAMRVYWLLFALCIVGLRSWKHE